MDSDFLYGKDKRPDVVGIHHDADKVYIWQKDGFGTRVTTEQSFLWKLYSGQPRPECLRLAGDLHYDNVWSTKDPKTWRDVNNEDRRFGNDGWVCWDENEAHMIRTGLSSWNNLTLKDLTVASFDIETTGLNAETSDLLMISTTILTPKGVTRHLYSIEDYKSEEVMIYTWAMMIKQADPDILVGHNVFGFDLPFLMEKCPGLCLGRAGLSHRSNKATFRRDGSQFYEFQNITIPGRSIVDTFYLAIKYDVGRSQPTYALKPLTASLWDDMADPIETLGVVQRTREIVNAALIKDIERGSPEWERAKQYCADDSDDAMLLFLHMIPPFFFMARYIPKTLQQIINGGTGSIVNSFLMRAYLQHRHSVPAAQAAAEYEGAISIGNPGLYSNVFKIDVASLYPSIIRNYEVYDKSRDPKAYLLKMTELFTLERLKNKKLGKDSKYHADLSAAQKIFINSIYGFMGAPGLNFNYPRGAASITRKGRSILMQAIALFCQNGEKV